LLDVRDNTSELAPASIVMMPREPSSAIAPIIVTVFQFPSTDLPGESSPRGAQPKRGGEPNRNSDSSTNIRLFESSLGCASRNAARRAWTAAVSRSRATSVFLRPADAAHRVAHRAEADRAAVMCRPRFDAIGQPRIRIRLRMGEQPRVVDGDRVLPPRGVGVTSPVSRCRRSSRSIDAGRFRTSRPSLSYVFRRRRGYSRRDRRRRRSTS